MELKTNIRFTGGAGGAVAKSISPAIKTFYNLVIFKLYEGFQKELQKGKDKGEIKDYTIIIADDESLEFSMFSDDRAYLEKEKAFVDKVINSWKTRYTLKLSGLSFKSELIEEEIK